MQITQCLATNFTRSAKIQSIAHCSNMHSMPFTAHCRRRGCQLVFSIPIAADRIWVHVPFTLLIRYQAAFFIGSVAIPSLSSIHAHTREYTHTPQTARPNDTRQSAFSRLRASSALNSRPRTQNHLHLQAHIHIPPGARPSAAVSKDACSLCSLCSLVRQRR